VSVKRSRSASRVLAVLEGIARHQPVGVSELARVLGADKSAVQRAIMTLADDGWIRTAPGTPTRWQLTAHMLAVAHTGHVSNDLRQRARSTLEALRDESGETVLLSVPDIGHFVVIDVLESRQLLRTAPHLGMIVPARGSATGLAILPHMSREQQTELLGELPDATLLAHFAATLERGFSISAGGVAAGSTSIAAPVVEADGRPVAAIVVSAPSERLTAEHYSRIGAMVLQAAYSLSRGTLTLPVASGFRDRPRRVE
jgi:DNA-binding IclR family transcriptional regulator